jgi:ABC-type glycerol-3-phosphate transport system substrate-binding protein
LARNLFALPKSETLARASVKLRGRNAGRFTGLIGMLLLAALTISACAAATSTPLLTSSPPTAATTAVATPVSTPTVISTRPAPIKIDASVLKGLHIQVWHALAGSSFDVFNRQVEQFNSTNEWGIQVSPTGFGDYTSLFDAVSAFQGSGQLPDLVIALPEQSLAWDAAGQVVDLNPYLEDPSWGMGAEALADIPAEFMAEEEVNGRQLGLPAQRTTRVLFYNKTWAHELGFDYPPATPAEFRQQACAANASFLKDNDLQNDSYGGWVIDADWQTSYSWLLAFGGGVVDGNDYSFRTEANLAALQFLKGLYDDHCAWLPYEPVTFNPFDAFAKRSALFVSGDLAELPQAGASMTLLKNSDEWEAIPFPGLQKSVLVDYGPSYNILKSTPEKQLAGWVFVRWLLSPENQAQWVEATGLLPLRRSLMSLVGSYKAASPQWGWVVDELGLAESVPQLASWRKVRYVLEDGLTTVFQTNTPVAKLPSILAEMDSTAQELNK